MPSNIGIVALSGRGLPPAQKQSDLERKSLPESSRSAEGDHKDFSFGPSVAYTQ